MQTEYFCDLTSCAHNNGFGCLSQAYYPKCPYIKALFAIPSKATWLPVSPSDKGDWQHFRCSKCKHKLLKFRLSKYCPSCGSRMINHEQKEG